MKRRPPPHEITLVAFSRNDDGTKSIVDIVETSNHFAYSFVKRWLRDPEVASIGTTRGHAHRDLSIRAIR